MIDAEQTKRGLRGLWALAVLFVAVGSLLPGNSGPMRILAALQIGDKVEHFGAYAAVAFLPAIHERWRVVIAAAVAAIAMGIGLEYGQLYSPERSFDIADMMADALGVGLGLSVGILLRRSGLMRSLLHPAERRKPEISEFIRN